MEVLKDSEFQNCILQKLYITKIKRQLYDLKLAGTIISPFLYLTQIIPLGQYQESFCCTSKVVEIPTRAYKMLHPVSMVALLNVFNSSYLLSYKLLYIFDFELADYHFCCWHQYLFSFQLTFLGSQTTFETGQKERRRGGITDHFRKMSFFRSFISPYTRSRYMCQLSQEDMYSLRYYTLFIRKRFPERVRRV